MSPSSIGGVLRLAAAVLLSLLGANVAADGSDARPRKADAVFVDAESVGGLCDDRRSAAAARSATTPFCSVEAAFEKAKGSLIYLRAGDYPTVRITGGRNSRYTTLRSFRRDGSRPSLGDVRVDGVARVRLEGLRIKRLVVGADARRISIVGNRIAQGMLLEAGARGIAVTSNRITAPAGDGILFASSYGRARISRIAIRRNRFHDIGRVGINARNFREVLIEHNTLEDVASFDGRVHTDVIRTFNGGTGLTIRGNLIRDSRAQGIFVKDGPVGDLTIENNVIAGIGGGFWALNLYDVRSARIAGNTVWNNSSGVVFPGRATDVVLVNNIFQSLKLPGSVSFLYRGHNLIRLSDGLRPTELRRDPRFVDPGRGDYRLAARSPAIDAGTSDWGTAFRDRRDSARVDDPRVRNRGDGSRPYYDLGAYERR